MDATQIIGICASTGTGISLLPQLIKIIKEKKAEQISLVMMLTLLAGLILWVFYGIRKDDPIIIISNGFSIIINVSITILSIKYKRK